MRRINVCRYPGGKTAVADYLVSLFPQNIKEYREPFVGGGSVYLAARQARIAKTFWINDKFDLLFSFWRVCSDENQCLDLYNRLRELRIWLATPAQVKAYFRSVRDEESSDLVRRAFLFFFFNRVTFSGTTAAGGFSESASMGRFTMSAIERLLKLPALLRFTTITGYDFSEVISSGGKDTFLFLDPPYITAKRLYGRKGELHNFDHERLAKCLRRTDHKFLMTYDDDPRIREFYSWADVRPFDVQYSMTNCDAKKTARVGKELLIRNYS